MMWKESGEASPALTGFLPKEAKSVPFIVSGWVVGYESGLQLKFSLLGEGLHAGMSSCLQVRWITMTKAECPSAHLFSGCPLLWGGGGHWKKGSPTNLYNTLRLCHPCFPQTVGPIMEEVVV